MIIKKMDSLWQHLLGPNSDFNIEKRAFHATSILTLLVLTLLLPFNMWIGLMNIVLVMVIAICIQAILYYLSRFRKQYYASIALYAIGTYITLIFTFYYNAGSNGPAIPLFFLAFILLLNVTPKRYHWLIVVTHVLTVISLLVTEFLYEGWVPPAYSHKTDRLIDLVSTYIISISFIYFTILYLRNNYVRAKKLAIARLADIEKQNKELESINREKNKLFSIISHDLRSPINSIQGYLELLNAEALAPEARAQLEGSLLDMTRNTSDMLYNLLTWSNTQMEGVGVHLKQVRLLDTLDNILKVEKIIAERKGISLEYDIDPAQTVQADEDMLQLVIRNLINNAIKFTHPGGRIFVRADSDGAVCTISVKDTGIGIPPEKAAGLFQLKNTHSFGTHNERGVGLGLVLCKEFMELQKGGIRLKTSPSGTTFHVSIPVV